MDRRSFINQDLLNNTNAGNKCQLDDCECEVAVAAEKQNSRITNSFHFATTAMMAFVFAIIISMVKTEAAKTNVTEVTLIDKEKVISCVPGYTNKKKLNDNHKPADRNDKSNCFHEQGSLCESRRRYTC